MVKEQSRVELNVQLPFFSFLSSQVLVNPAHQELQSGAVPGPVQCSQLRIGRI